MSVAVSVRESVAVSAGDSVAVSSRDSVAVSAGDSVAVSVGASVVTAGGVVASGRTVTVVVDGRGQEPDTAGADDELAPFLAGAAKATEERARRVKERRFFENMSAELS